MFDFLKSILTSVLGNAWYQNLALELASEPIEHYLGKAINAVKDARIKSEAFRDAEESMAVLVDNLGEAFLEELKDELTEKGILKPDRGVIGKIKALFSKKGNDFDPKEFNNLFLKSLDFSVDAVMKLKCVNKLDDVNKKHVRRAFENIRRVLTEMHINMLEKDQLMLASVIDYRLGAALDNKFEEFKSYFEGLFSAIEYIDVTECPFCGRSEREEFDGNKATCKACGHSYALKARKLSKSGSSLNALLNTQLKEIMDELVIISKDTNDTVHIIDQNVNSIDRKLSLIEQKITDETDERSESMKKKENSSRPYIVNNGDGNHNKIINSSNSVLGLVSIAACLLITGVVIAIVLF